VYLNLIPGLFLKQAYNSVSAEAFPGPSIIQGEVQRLCACTAIGQVQRVLSRLPSNRTNYSPQGCATSAAANGQLLLVGANSCSASPALLLLLLLPPAREKYLRITEYCTQGHELIFAVNPPNLRDRFFFYYQATSIAPAQPTSLGHTHTLDPSFSCFCYCANHEKINLERKLQDCSSTPPRL
jgi:hypothetical protein